MYWPRSLRCCTAFHYRFGCSNPSFCSSCQRLPQPAEAGHWLACFIRSLIGLLEPEHAIANHDSVDRDIHSICPGAE